MVNLAHQQGTDRAVGHRGLRHLAPACINPGFVCRMKPPVCPHDADIQMIMRDDRRHFGPHRPDRRPKIQLPGQKSGNPEKLIQPRGWGKGWHLWPPVGQHGAEWDS